MKVAYNKNELYQAYLSEINGIKFTAREIDIISCVVHNRGNKKIAVLLLIANRTVDAHIYNITSKISQGSKDGIIDFAEKSGRMLHIKAYYVCLLIEASFNKKLLSIAKTINKTAITYTINDASFVHESQEAIKVINQKLQQLQKDLQLANVILSLNVSQSVYFYILKPSGDGDRHLDQEIGLLFDDVTNTSTTQKAECIDFTTKQNYYFSTFDLLKKIINKPELDGIKEEFQKEYNSILDSTNNEQVSIVKDHRRTSEEQVVKIYKTKSAKILISVFIVFLISMIFIIYHGKIHELTSDKALSKVPRIEEFNLIKNRIQDAAGYFTRDQTTTKFARQNNKNILILQKDIDYLLKHPEYLYEDDVLQSKFCYLVTVLAAYYRWSRDREIVVDDYLNREYKECTPYNKVVERFHLCVHSILLERAVQYYQDRYKIAKDEPIRSIIHKLNREAYVLEDFITLIYAQARMHFPVNSWNGVDISNANKFITRYLDMIGATHELSQAKPFDVYLVLKYQQVIKRYAAESLITALQKKLQQEFAKTQDSNNLISIINSIQLTPENLLKLEKIINPSLNDLQIRLNELTAVIPLFADLLNDKKQYIINDKPWRHGNKKYPVEVIIPKDDRFNIGTLVGEILLTEAIIMQYNALLYYVEQEKLYKENKQTLSASLKMLREFSNNHQIQNNWNDVGVIWSKEKIKRALETFKECSYNKILSVNAKINIQTLIDKILDNKFNPDIIKDLNNAIDSIEKDV